MRALVDDYGVFKKRKVALDAEIRDTCSNGVSAVAGVLDMMETKGDKIFAGS